MFIKITKKKIKTMSHDLSSYAAWTDASGKEWKKTIELNLGVGKNSWVPKISSNFLVWKFCENAVSAAKLPVSTKFPHQGIRLNYDIWCGRINPYKNDFILTLLIKRTFAFWKICKFAYIITKCEDLWYLAEKKSETWMLVL